MLNKSFFAIKIIVAVSFLTALPTYAVTKVPAGNRSASQPPIPSASKSRTQSTGGTFDSKYQKIRDQIKNNKQLKSKIKKAAKQYKIAPIHIVGALIGEHTYNVDALDHMQTYYVKAISYLNSDIQFAYEGENVVKFVQRKEFSKCSEIKNSYDLWSCREAVWKTSFKGKTVDGTSYPNDRFSKVFFQPFFAGQTFGLGQLNPLTALRVTDIVAKTSRKKKLSASKGNQLYKTIMDPDSTLLYMAAVIRVSIDAYRDIAKMDISDNPGITATLYNLGNVKARARRSRGKIPRENYYGWLVNEKRNELEAILK